jgi:hypothetical protein
MEPLIQLTVLTAATVFAAGSAIALNWILLRTALQLMQPASVRLVRPVRSELVHGKRVGAHEFALHRKAKSRMANGGF